MTNLEYRRVWRMLTGLWPHYGPTEATLEAAEELLADLDVDVVLAAVKFLAVAEPTFAPGPGRIRACAADLVGIGGPSGEQALAEVMRVIGSTGRYRTPEWSSPAIAAAVEALGGWQACCDSDNPEAFRAHFLRIYEPMARRGFIQAVLPESVQLAIETHGGLKRLDVELAAIVDGA